MEIEENKVLLMPGTLISEDESLMGGNGTYMVDKKIYSALVGYSSVMGKFINVIPKKSKYKGESGDVVIGRVNEIFN